MLQASILLATFIKILWSLSTAFVFHVAGRQFEIPGYMVWAAVVYSGSASLLSYWVGRSLVDRNADRYAREADLRFSLVRVNEHIDAIALARGEADEARRIEFDLGKRTVGDARLGDRHHESHLGHRGLWLVHAGCADPGGRAACTSRGASPSAD